MRVPHPTAVLTMLAFVWLASTAQAPSGTLDTRETRRAAAERYLTAVPIDAMVADMVSELAKQVPEEKRREFVDLMHKLLPTDRLRALTLSLSVKHFTT